MKLYKKFTALINSLLFFTMVIGLTTVLQAQTRAYRVNDREVENLISRIETRGDKFKSSLDTALDKSRYNDTNRETNINNFVQNWEDATDELKRHFGSRSSAGSDVERVLVEAARIDDFMRTRLNNNNSASAEARRDWNLLRSDLNLLASYYNLSFNLDNRRTMPNLATRGVLTNSDARLTGTYTLDTVNSRNRTNNYRNQQAMPETIMIERQGSRVIIASSLTPQMTVEADNRMRSERYPNGQTSNVRAVFYGDNLTIESRGNRANEFSVTFAPLENGRRMLVTRKVYTSSANQPTEISSYYTRTSATAQFDMITNRYPNTAIRQTRNSNFLVPNNTVLTATLNTDISTKTSREGDRFTATVRSPAQYAGAVIEGYVSNVNRSGRVTGRSEITLNYETIRLRNNRVYSFTGFTESVTNSSNGRLRVDNESAIRDSDNQTTRTVGRTAVGAGIGALIGAIAGGGQGAAVGAAVGAGAGAGSVFIQGRDDLELNSGSELMIRASAPRQY